jgi:hypothetical protein
VRILGAVEAWAVEGVEGDGGRGQGVYMWIWARRYARVDMVDIVGRVAAGGGRVRMACGWMDSSRAKS